MAEKKSTKPVIVPLGDRVLVRPLSDSELETTSTSGIILPDTVSKERPERGIVVRVGEGFRNDAGELIPMRVSEGDEIVFSKYGFDEFEFENTTYFILKEDSILAVITK